MNQQLAAWQTRFARACLMHWNADHPERYVAWETVEEMLLARRDWRALRRVDWRKAREHYARYIEFKAKLPRELLAEIFGTD